MTRVRGRTLFKEAAGGDGLTVVLARERFSVVWAARGLQLHITGQAAPTILSASEARHLADLLTAAADFEAAA